MKLNEALAKVAAARALPAHHRVYLGCGFEPLHLPTFLQAEYLCRFEGRSLTVEVGVYGDLAGNIERAVGAQVTVACVAMEWADLDPRLGLRSSGPWSGPHQADVLSTVEQGLARCSAALQRLAERTSVVVSLPSVPFLLAGHTSGWQASELELELELAVARFAALVARGGRVRVLHPARLSVESAPSARRDPRAELHAGFPHSIEHASALARGFIELAFPKAPKKGLITDLDDTLWAGVVGEVGPASVDWSLEGRAQVHGLYQLFLQHLSEAGVLLGVASKNEPDVALAALGRSDLALDKDHLFPVAVSWGPKSEAVSAILRAWNIGADAVVVVDDSRMELEEIRRVHSGITCLEFSPKDPRRTLELLLELRDLFGKPQTLPEDKLRRESIRSLATFGAEQEQSGDLGDFLGGLSGTVTFDSRTTSGGERLFELINKTNQFNANGTRLTESEWRRCFADGYQILGVSYVDRLGPLGTIAAVVVRHEGGVPIVEHWVQSCRAFSRRIEDHTLRHLLDAGASDRIRLRYRRTERNKPFQEFLARLGLGGACDGDLDIGRAALDRLGQVLPHREVRTHDG